MVRNNRPVAKSKPSRPIPVSRPRAPAVVAAPDPPTVAPKPERETVDVFFVRITDAKFTREVAAFIAAVNARSDGALVMSRKSLTQVAVRAYMKSAAQRTLA